MTNEQHDHTRGDGGNNLSNFGKKYFDHML